MTTYAGLDWNQLRDPDEQPNDDDDQDATPMLGPTVAADEYEMTAQEAADRATLRARTRNPYELTADEQRNFPRDLVEMEQAIARAKTKDELDKLVHNAHLLEADE